MSGRRLQAACPQPCSACPWRASNQGTRHPHGWYTKKNAARLWALIRRGETMSCHPTDPDNTVPEGWRAAPEGNAPNECTGMLILVQRELTKVQSYPAGQALRHYLRAHKRGLTSEGVLCWADRHVFGGVPLLGSGPAISRDLNLNLPGVAYAPLGSWEEWYAANVEGRTA